jgi:hypothetical protein
MRAETTLEQLAARVTSLSIDCRRPDQHWPKRWRARGNATANSPMVTTFGDTLEAAVAALVDKLDKEQAARRPS